MQRMPLLLLLALLIAGLLLAGCAATRHSAETKRPTIEPIKPQAKPANHVKPAKEAGKTNIESKTANSKGRLSSAKLRHQKYEYYLRCAKLVATQTKDTEAQMLWQFLAKNGQFAAELPSELPKLDQQTFPKFKVYCLLPTDKVDWAKETLNNLAVGGSYLPSHQAMRLLRDGQMSDLLMGTVVLHEVRHARTYLVTHPEWSISWAKRSAPDEKIYCYDEMETHRFQYRLLLKLDRTAYEPIVSKMQDLLNRDARRKSDPLRAIFQQNGVSGFGLGYPIPGNPPFQGKEIDEITQMISMTKWGAGNTSNINGRLLCLSFVYEAALFRLADKYATNPDDAVAQYLLWTYQKMGHAS